MPIASTTRSCFKTDPCPPEKPQGRLIMGRPFSVLAGPETACKIASLASQAVSL